MSAWYVLGAMAFYPMCPGDNTYILGSPLFSKVTLRLDPKWYKGETFFVIANNQAAVVALAKTLTSETDTAYKVLVV